MERALYRIADANINRASEALRVMEEFCRFVIGSESLTGRVRGLRHGLRTTAASLDEGRLLSARDTAGDVGRHFDGAPGGRTRDFDAFRAASRRLTEALRVLSEMFEALGVPVAASEVERFRYETYQLEKDALLEGLPLEKFRRVRLYVITDLSDPDGLSAMVRACAAGGAEAMQLRLKGVADSQWLSLARIFSAECARCGVLSIINDRADIATASGADGVHLGSQDIPVAAARELAARPLVIGATTHSIEQLRCAIRQRPSYVSLGPVYSSPTKPAMAVAGPGYLSSGLAELEGKGLGHVAVGGIDADTIEEVLAAGARAVALCSAVASAAEAGRAVRDLRLKIDSFPPPGPVKRKS